MAPQQGQAVRSTPGSSPSVRRASHDYFVEACVARALAQTVTVTSAEPAPPARAATVLAVAMPRSSWA